MNYSELLQLAKGWGNFVSDRINIWRLLFKFIYTFHMPLFMVISGYLFHYTIKQKDTLYIMKAKLRSLVLPIITFGVLSELLSVVRTQHINITEMTMDFMLSLKHRFWFLWAAFFACLMVLTINRIFHDNVVVYIISVLVSILIPESWGIRLILFLYPHFLFGYWYGKYNLKKRINKRWDLFLLMLVIYIICFFCYNEQTYIYIGGLSILSKNWKTVLYQDFVRLLIGLVGVYLWCVLIKKSIKYLPQVIKNIVAIIGQNSMGVYIVSSYLNLYVLMRITYNFKANNLFLSVLETLGVTVISMIIIKIIECSNVLKFFLFGKT